VDVSVQPPAIAGGSDKKLERAARRELTNTGFAIRLEKILTKSTSRNFVRQTATIDRYERHVRASALSVQGERHQPRVN
jgi:hypothetical protein